MTSALCLVHQRFSTNTFPSWQLAHPYRYICHNGEINTLRGNVNWMYARQSVLASPLFGEDIKKLLPIITPGGSDSAMLDNAVELLTLAGRSLPHVMSMLIPEAWDHDPTMPEDVKAFYEYHASLMEPWDGPAAVAFTDGRVIGAKLDRNGLRPGRYLVTTDGLVVMASEAGVLPVKPEDVRMKGRLAPGRMLLVDTEQKRLISDEEVKKQLGGAAALRAVGEGKSDHARPSAEPDARAADRSRHDPDAPARLRLHGRGPEDDSAALRALKARRAGRLDGHRHAAGVPFRQAATAVQLFQADLRAGHQSGDRSDPRRPGDVAQQLHRLAKGTSSKRRRKNCHTLKLRHPIISNWRLEKLRRVSWGDFLATTLPMLFRVEGGEQRAGKGRRDALPPRLAGDQVRLHAADSFRPRRGRRVRAHSEPAGAFGRAQPSDPREDAQSGGADRGIGRAARSDALRAAAGLRRERRESLPGHRNAGRSAPRRRISRRTTPGTRSSRTI